MGQHQHGMCERSPYHTVHRCLDLLSQHCPATACITEQLLVPVVLQLLLCQQCCYIVRHMPPDLLTCSPAACE